MGGACCINHINHDQDGGKLRLWITKNGPIPEEEFLGTMSVSYQNYNYFSKCTTDHRNFGAEIKTRVSVSKSSFESKAKMTNFSPNIFRTFY